ncbi:MAG: NAD(P)-dependent alcohol dehydrogenase [Pseudorhodoplanes sp.]|uniref:NAD(P)-dependent alcohol dehydrogenase n=1 Tax=Pseudorhodoplanes sp. TaxID=1934341 RepID=UPI003D0D52CA
MAMMKAALCREYGPPENVRIEQIAKPEPKPDEVLIRIRATTVSSGDWRVRTLTVPRGMGIMVRAVFGFTRPRNPILGTELAGEIEAVGKDVTNFRIGETVIGYPSFPNGCHAEYRTMRESDRIVAKPARLSYEEAAALCFGGATALDFLRDRAKLQTGEHLLVIGASGTLGSAAVQLAKHFGAHVTGICSAANVELVRSIGADRVIDYTCEDYRNGGETYDVIFDAVGVASFRTHETFLKPNGRLLLLAAGLHEMLEAIGAKRDGKRVFSGPAKERLEHLTVLAGLAESGAYRPVIDQVFPFERIADAHARVETGRKRGSVVVTVDQDKD